LSEDKLKVILSGACGRMGRMIAADFLTSGKVELVGAIDSVEVGGDIGVFAGCGKADIEISPTLEAAMENTGADVLLDFSTLQASLHNVPTALMKGIDCLIGVTGFTDGDIEKFKMYSEQSGKAVWIVPNFSPGVNLMMEFAKRAAKMYPDCEIIELHHDGKKDAPSGTALKTARDMRKTDTGISMKPAGYASRGLEINDIHVHSIRLPGLLAHQEVIFGGRGEVFTIRHDAMSRECFLPGIYLALEKISEKEGLVVGMEGLF
jgi:4-hydroxy-tetrahydrodipicolinate reductase